MPSTPTNRSRQVWSVRIAVILFAAAAISQARVHVVERSSIMARAVATDRFVISKKEFAKRGAIFSADGKPLAQDDDTYEFSIRFDKSPASDAFFVALGEASGIPASEFAQAARSGQKSLTWRKAMSSAQAQSIQAVKLAWRADGVSIGRTNQRAYPLGASAAGFIGALKKDAGPIAGLELSQDKVLAGIDGQTVGVVDKLGSFLPTRLDPATRSKRDGENIMLTIDSNLQQEATVALKNAVESNDADSGVAIVMDPKTGDILAMANWPSYDPNAEVRGTQPRERSDMNPAYMSVLEPGSTFKILTLAKALDAGVVKPDDTFYCSGALQVWSTRAIHCDLHGGTRAHGQLTPESAIAKSCNVWAATWAGLVGYPDFVRYMENLGLMKRTNLGVPLEAAGQFKYDEYAKPLQLAVVGFGQSISCTPVSLTAAFAMLANDGKRPEPRLIKRIGEKDQPIGKQTQIVSKDTAAQVMKFMEAVFGERGTAKTLNIPGYRLAGKTGTAERVRNKDGGGYVANFVGFVPAEKPRAVVLVMIDRPKAGSYYGGSVAGPVFVDVAKSIIRRFAIPPSQPRR